MIWLYFGWLVSLFAIPLYFVGAGRPDLMAVYTGTFIYLMIGTRIYRNTDFDRYIHK